MRIYCLRRLQECHMASKFLLHVFDALLQEFKQIFFPYFILIQKTPNHLPFPKITTEYCKYIWYNESCIGII